MLHNVNVASQHAENRRIERPCQGQTGACVGTFRRGTATGVNFGKIAFGAVLLAVGVLLLAVQVGLTHPDTPVVLLRFWPLLLIAFGLAFLAGAIKNPMLGCFAILLILGGTALGMFWMSRLQKEGKLTRAASSLDLARAGVSSLTVRVHSFAGAFDLRATPGRSTAVTVGRDDAAADSAQGYRFEIGGARAILTWPRDPAMFGYGPPGARLEVRVPRAIPLSLRWAGKAASMRADLAGVRTSRIELHQVASSSRISFDDAGRPEEIRIWGVASILNVRIPADCPVRLITKSNSVSRSVPSDFEEHAPGRGRDRIETGAGRGTPVRIVVDGPFMRIKIERMPLTAVSTSEDLEWPDPSTASRSRSPSS